MHVGILVICVLKYMSLILRNFFQLFVAWEAALKKNKIKLDLLTDIDMLLIVEKGIRRGTCHPTYR